MQDQVKQLASRHIGALCLHSGLDQDRWGWLARRLVQEDLISESNDGAQRLFLKESGRRFLNKPWPLKYCV